MTHAEPYAAPAGRSTEQDLSDEQLLIDQSEFVTTLMEAMPSLAMILNEHRQILIANDRLIQVFGISDFGRLIGRRPGEALGCIHHGEGSDGCGTAPNCSVCGAALAILTSRKINKQVSAECRLTLGKNCGTALDLEGTATPLKVGGREFTISALRDISDEKRKQVMERTFFHDIINTASGIRGLASLLVERCDSTSAIASDYPELMVALSDNLIEEIKHQRRLLAAERGEYIPELEEVELGVVLRELCALYGHHERVPGRTVRLHDSAPCRLRTDPPVLRRIVGNMLLNALEAIGKGQTVEVGYEQSEGSVRIFVANPGQMSPEVQLQIFQRSFSNKGAAGRGIGTYSMKLFGERYLGGEVGFSSREGLTTFYIILPIDTDRAH
ncbi:MAG TPA: HAMP domain-containing sensor histidine kinase [Desulfuromonadaceae bacterium]|jgi:hypothetical protein